MSLIEYNRGRLRRTATRKKVGGETTRCVLRRFTGQQSWQQCLCLNFEGPFRVHPWRSTHPEVAAPLPHPPPTSAPYHITQKNCIGLRMLAYIYHLEARNSFVVTQTL